MKTGRSWDGSCCRGARKSCRRGGSTTRLKDCCALATLNYEQCALLPIRSSRCVSNEREVGATFRYSGHLTIEHYNCTNARPGIGSSITELRRARYCRDARTRIRSCELQIVIG